MDENDALRSSFVASFVGCLIRFDFLNRSQIHAALGAAARVWLM